MARSGLCDGLARLQFFLLIVYLGVTTGYDAHIASDYWRYTSHVALFGLFAPVVALAVGTNEIMADSTGTHPPRFMIPEVRRNAEKSLANRTQ
jgi:hypothetical protein